MQTLAEHKNPKLRVIDPFSKSQPSDARSQSERRSELSANAEKSQSFKKNAFTFPASLLGLLSSSDKEVTQAWMEQNFQKVQEVIRYLNNDLQFRLLGFIPVKVLLELLLDEEAEVRKRHFEWCCKHPSSRTARNTVHIQAVVDEWLDDYAYRLTLAGAVVHPKADHQSIPPTVTSTGFENQIKD